MIIKHSVRTVVIMLQFFFIDRGYYLLPVDSMIRKMFNYNNHLEFVINY